MPTQAAEKGTFNVKYYVHSAIVIILMFGFPLLPTIEPLTPYGMQVAGIFLGCLYGWTTVGIIWPSILGLIKLAFAGFGTMTATFTAAYGNDTYLFVFFMLAFAALVSKAGVTDFIAKWVVSRKIAAGKPYVIAFFVYLAAYVVAALVSVMPSIVICWTLAYQLFDEFGYTNKDKYPKLMVIGVVIAALAGQCVFPFKPFAVIMTGVLNTQLGLSIDFATFTFFAFVLGFGQILIWLAICKFVYRPDTVRIENGSFTYDNDEKLNAYQIQVLALLLVLVLCMFLPGFLPDCGLKTFLKTMGNTGLVLAALGICSFIQLRNGKSFADVADLIKTGVPWPTMFLLGTAMAIASAISGETGISALFKQILTPIFAGNNAVLFFVLCIVATLVLTNIINNVVVGMLMVPLICTFSQTLGFPPEILVVAICVVCNVTYFLPSGSPIAAFLHGNSEWISSSECQKYSALFLLAFAAYAIAICLTVGNLIW